MTLQEFKDTLSGDAPPSGTGPVLRALWMDARGDWDGAHRTVQDMDGREAAWVHAYLHRKEGDSSNASYWYSRAGRRASSAGFEEEWEQIVTELLE